jgi:hypothetical protein
MIYITCSASQPMKQEIRTGGDVWCVGVSGMSTQGPAGPRPGSQVDGSVQPRAYPRPGEAVV